MTTTRASLTTQPGAVALATTRERSGPAPGAVRLYPLGYPVDFAANSERAIEAASDIWGAWPKIFDSFALTMLIQVHPGSRPAGVQRFDARNGLLRFACDEINISEFNPAERIGRLSIGSEALEDGPCFRHHWLETLVLTALDSIFFTPLHAACVAKDGGGILLCGDSGAGKSTLAYACARAGWTLVSDDAFHLAPGCSRVGVGGSSLIRLREPSRELFPELSAFQVKRTLNGKSAIEIDAPAHGFQTARQARIKRFVFLRRRPGPARVSAFAVPDAIDYFLKYLLPRETSRAQRHLRQVLTSEPVLLEFERVEDAMEALA